MKWVYLMIFDGDGLMLLCIVCSFIEFVMFILFFES